MFLRKISVLFFSFFSVFSAVAAEDCLPYKLEPQVFINTPVWTKEVVQPLREMDLLHGNVIATLTDNYDIIVDITPIEDGFCIALKSVDAIIGYSDFLVQIDIRHVPGTCSYDAILSHEDEHIRAYLSIIDDLEGELKKAIYDAADSIMPLFVPDTEGIDSAIDELNLELQAHPDLILIKQKIRAEEEIRNGQIDIHNNGSSLEKCFEQ